MDYFNYLIRNFYPPRDIDNDNLLDNIPDEKAIAIIANRLTNPDSGFYHDPFVHFTDTEKRSFIVPPSNFVKTNFSQILLDEYKRRTQIDILKGEIYSTNLIKNLKNRALEDLDSKANGPQDASNKDEIERINSEINRMNSKINRMNSEIEQLELIQNIEIIILLRLRENLNQEGKERQLIKVELPSQEDLDKSDPNNRETIDLCQICYDKKIDMVFLPCGHKSVCHRCANIPVAIKLLKGKCIQCQTPCKRLVYETMVHESVDVKNMGVNPHDGGRKTHKSKRSKRSKKSRKSKRSKKSRKSHK